MALILCPKCSTRLQVADSLAAQQVRCSVCTTPLLVAPSRPASPAPAPTPTATGRSLTFRCPRCGQAMWARPEDAGKLTQCGRPECHQVCSIPLAPAPTAPSAVIQAPAAPAASPPASAPVLPPPDLHKTLAPPVRTTPPVTGGSLLVKAGVGMTLCAFLIVGVGGARNLFHAAVSPDDPTVTSEPDPSVDVADRPVSHLAFLPGRPRELWSVRMRDLWNSPGVRKAWAKLPEHVRAPADLASREFGFDPADYERVTIVLAPAGVAGGGWRESWVVLETTRPFDETSRRKLLAAVAGDVRWERRSYRGLSYDLARQTDGVAGDTLAVYRASDRILVAGPESGLHRALDQFLAPDRGGELAPVLSLIERGNDHLVMAALHGVGRAGPATGMGRLVQLPPDVSASRVVARLDSMIHLKAALTFSDPPGAGAFLRQFEQLKRLGQQPVHLAEGIRDTAIGAQLREQLAGLGASLNGREVELRIELELERLAAHLPDLLTPQAVTGDTSVNSAAHLKKIALAFEQYHKAHGRYPQAVYRSQDGKAPLYSWRVALLPYLGEKKLYDEFDRGKPWDDPKNRRLLAKMPAVYAPPGVASAATEGHTRFLLLTGPAAAFHESNTVTKKDIADGPARTLLLVEHADGVPWTAPRDAVVPDEVARVEKELLPRLGRGPTDLFHAARFDGSVLVLPRSMKATIFLQAVNPRDGLGLPTR